MDHIAYLLALHSIHGLGPIRLRAILEYFKDPKLAWEASQEELIKIGIPKNAVDLLVETRKNLDPLTFAQSMKDSGISWKTYFDSSYPKLLKQIYDPPAVLYYKGEFEKADEKAIALVGSRKMSGYGRAVTEGFTKGLVAGGLTIVSGLARGVDTWAHTIAIKEGGRTLAVLGGGLNRLYPPENKNLAEEIIKGHGVLLSEYPPNDPVLSGNFPSRNRIISGLSLAVLVTEAAEDSGSLITARLALEQGRDVFAVPGPATSMLSRGPISLIRMGARPVFEAGEILKELGIVANIKKVNQIYFNLSTEEQSILNLLENETLHIDEIGRSLKLPPAKVSALLIKMEISGFIQSMGSGMYSKI